MRLLVRHATRYQFDAPMRFVTQSHRLTPAANASQEVLRWTVACEGAVFGAAFVDGAGEHVNTMTVQGPVEHVEILVEGEVETADPLAVIEAHALTDVDAGIARGQGERPDAHPGPVAAVLEVPEDLVLGHVLPSEIVFEDITVTLPFGSTAATVFRA